PDAEARVGVRADLDSGGWRGAEAGEEGDGGLVGVVGGGQDLGEGEDVEGVGQDGGGGLGGQALGPVGGGEAVEELDAEGRLEGAEAAGADQGGGGGGAGGPKAPCGGPERLGAVGDQVGHGLEGDEVGVPQPTGDLGVVPVGVEGGKVVVPDRGQDQAGGVEGGRHGAIIVAQGAGRTAPASLGRQMEEGGTTAPGWGASTTRPCPRTCP